MLEWLSSCLPCNEILYFEESNHCAAVGSIAEVLRQVTWKKVYTNQHTWHGPVAVKFEAMMLGVRLVTLFSEGVVFGKANGDSSRASDQLTGMGGDSVYDTLLGCIFIISLLFCEDILQFRLLKTWLGN